MPYIKASSTQTLIGIMLWSQQLRSKIYMQLIMIQLSDQFLSQNQYHLIIFIKKAVSLFKFAPSTTIASSIRLEYGVSPRCYLQTQSQGTYHNVSYNFVDNNSS